MANWNPPDGPLPSPHPARFDAASLTPSKAVDGGATRETSSCAACIAVRRKKKCETPHSLRWGECLNATPPPPEEIPDLPEDYGLLDIPEDEDGEQDIEESDLPGERRQIVQKEEEGEELNLVASARHVKKGKNNISERHATLLECPHACIAYSDVPATWGSRSEGNISDTDVPSTSDELEEDEPHTDDDFEYDEEFAVRGGTQGPCLLYTSPSPRDRG